MPRKRKKIKVVQEICPCCGNEEDPEEFLCPYCDSYDHDYDMDEDCYICYSCRKKFDVEFVQG